MRSYRTLDAGPFGGMGMTPGVKILLIANVAVFIVQAFLKDLGRGSSGALTDLFAFVPGQAIIGLEVWRFFTYMFLHGGVSHILFNMLGLWMFGTQVESHWGRGPFLLYYLVCGLGGALTYGVIKLFTPEAFAPMIGASGAVLGLLLAYGMMFPEAIILVAFVVPMKAKYAVALFGLIDVLSMISDTGSDVAHWAHLGGMGAGFIFLRLTIPSLRAGTGLRNPFRQWRGKRRLKVVRPAGDARQGANGQTRPGGGRPAGGPAAGDRPSSDKAQVDAILDKISREGLQSLTPHEQDVLRRAGRR